VTVWEERGQEAGVSVWRLWLKEPTIGQQRGIAYLEELVTFREQELVDSDQVGG